MKHAEKYEPVLVQPAGGQLEHGLEAFILIVGDVEPACGKPLFDLQLHQQNTYQIGWLIGHSSGGCRPTRPSATGSFSVAILYRFPTGV